MCVCVMCVCVDCNNACHARMCAVGGEKGKRQES